MSLADPARADLPCVVFTGGGTGGHVYPGLAVAARLRALRPLKVVWIGSGKLVERRAVEAAGIEFLAIPSGKLRREFSLHNAVDAFRVAAGYLAARRILKRLAPALVFSKGGYVSVPPCAAAAGLGIPVFTHESDATPGLATRLNARKAERVFVSYEATRARFGEAIRPRVELSGNPVRTDLDSGDAARGRAFLDAKPGLPLVLFLGGSQGARQVNELALSCLEGLEGKAFVAHQTGEGVTAPSERESYRALPFIGAELPDVLAAADLVVARAGAATLWECAKARKPLILIPLSGAGTRGDQVDNARLFVASGAARALIGDEAKPDALLAEILGLLEKPEEAKRMAEAAASLTGMDAASLIAARILERIGAAS